MFLDLDKKPLSAIAVVDDSGSQMTYGELCEYSKEFHHVIPTRTHIFILAENTIDSLLGYIGALSNGVVPLILSRNTERMLFERLRDMYSPEYMWAPSEMVSELGGEVIYNHGRFVMLKTGMEPPMMNKDLSLLLPTSGSTGSPKLVRHSYRNIEANARNVAELENLLKISRTLRFRTTPSG